MGDGDEIEVVRGLWARWNSGERDFDAETIDPEVEIHSHLTRTVYRGIDGVKRWTAEIDQQFDGWRIEIDQVERRDDGSVLVTGSIHGHGRQSGIDLHEPAAWTVELRDGRLLRMHNFIGREAVASVAGPAS